MKNKLSDLQDHLFMQLERLGDEGLDADKLKQEIERGKAITQVAAQIIANGKLVLDAHIAVADNGIKHMPKMLGLGSDGA